METQQVLIDSYHTHIAVIVYLYFFSMEHVILWDTMVTD